MNNRLFSVTQFRTSPLLPLKHPLAPEPAPDGLWALLDHKTHLLDPKDAPDGLGSLLDPKDAPSCSQNAPAGGNADGIGSLRVWSPPEIGRAHV